MQGQVWEIGLPFCGPEWHHPIGDGEGQRCLAVASEPFFPPSLPGLVRDHPLSSVDGGGEKLLVIGSCPRSLDPQRGAPHYSWTPFRRCRVQTLRLECRLCLAE